MRPLRVLQVASCEPKFSRRIALELMLEPPAAGQPPHYIVMPYSFYAGVEADFSLVVRADVSDAPTSGTPEAFLEPVTPEEDW